MKKVSICLKGLTNVMSSERFPVEDVAQGPGWLGWGWGGGERGVRLLGWW